ncbi:MAG: glutamate-5-semialdehyde dehydrogenase [Deltaproteobacteria bacterium]|nr:glutamate-5-semialdehyde dehydrogenase [Deltaproteobacteria bacterium]
MTITLRQLAEQARIASRQLANLSTERKNEVLLAFAKKIRENTEPILSANKKDLESADRLRSQGELSDSSIQRLKLNAGKIEQMAKNFESVAALPDPVGQVQLATRLDEGLDLHQVSCPIGVLLVIFESRPEVVVQISALTLKSGNAVILKGGKEASESNACLFRILDQVLGEFTDLPAGTVNLLQSREAVSEIVQLNDCLDLIIPRGSNALVQHIQQHSRVPVLAHADGICHVYWDRSATLSKAMEIIIDAKTEYPAVCNAMETLLIHEQIPESEISQVFSSLLEAGVELRVCSAIMKKFSSNSDRLVDASEQDWAKEYTDLILSVRLVSSIDEAIGHINQYGSGHTDTIIAEDRSIAEKFMDQVDAANVFWNASTRFADGFRYGFGAEVGVSTCKTHARGPVGLDGLIIYKYKLYGNGQGVARYHEGGRQYLHQPLSRLN